MVRGLPIERWWSILAVTALVVGVNVADAANTSRPTGRGAIHDNSVYCQNSPGQPARPAYRGTGSQNPFGGECGPGPQPQPQPQPQAEDEACPASHASLPSPGVILVANSPNVASGLWVADHQVGSAREVGLQGLTQVRKEIFEAMRCSKNRVFRFKDKQRLKDTIELRAKIVERMEALLHNRSPLCFRQDGVSLPSEWQFYSEPRGTLVTSPWGNTAARSKPGVSADKAIQSLRAEGARLECQWGMQMTVLDAAHSALGKNRFEAVHPVRSWPDLPPQVDGRPSEHALAGLGVPLLTDEDVLVFWSHIVNNASYTSLAEHLFVVRYHLPEGFRNRGSRDPANDPFAGPIKAADMVPGDWVYLKNVPDYETLVSGGAYAGENAFYMRERTRGDPRSRVFYGFGLPAPQGEAPRFLTELEIATEMAADFNASAQGRRFEAQPADMVWTRLGGPILDDTDLHEAGLFVR
jgi:Protein-glutamine gamma-glutamyltransferase